MNTSSSVTSKDGTTIAYQHQGEGPAVILVGGGLDDGSENATLATELAKNFSVYNYSRRGRGESSDTQPYALEREIEDIAALIAEGGGSAHLYGVSSGGALALEATAAGLAVHKVAVYEVPYQIGEQSVQIWQEYVKNLNTVLANNDRDAALVLFMHLAGSTEDDIQGAKSSPVWKDLETVAPTLAYDAACLGDGNPPVKRLATIKQPTLVATGTVLMPGMNELQPSFFSDAADAIVVAMPHAERLSIEGQSHVVDSEVLAPVLEKFFKN